MFFSRKQKLIFGIEDTMTKPDWNTKKKDFQHISGGCRPGGNQLSPSALYMFGLFIRLFTSEDPEKTTDLSQVTDT